MHLFSARNLNVLAFVFPVFTVCGAAQQGSALEQGNILRPINIVEYEASMGLQRRDSNDLSVLDPQRQSQLVYGSPGGESSGYTFYYHHWAADQHQKMAKLSSQT